jgi:NAD(P)-dependent dehydrogenase (short-subunit alcohol dehydrogenase family)
MERLKGKTAVITGSASGIGRATALLFAREGANVVGGDLNPEGGQEVAAQCRDMGVGAVALRMDVTSESDISALIELAADKFGGVDILFNNAGAGGAVGPIESIPVEHWDRTQNILLRSVFLGIKYAVPHMKKGGGGSIISTASIAGMRGFPYLHGYCAAKAGIINLTRSAAIELGAANIRVNSISPGQIVTPINSGGLSAEALESKLSGHQPIIRAGTTEDIAAAALYLASDDARWVTGINLAIDGGQTIGVWTYGQSPTLDHTQKSGFVEASYVRAKAASA